jgi:hypothetical protein
VNEDKGRDKTRQRQDKGKDEGKERQTTRTKENRQKETKPAFIRHQFFDTL